MKAELRARLHGLYSANFNDGEPVGERYGSSDMVNISQVIDFIDDHLVGFVQQEIAKARIDEIRRYDHMTYRSRDEFEAYIQQRQAELSQTLKEEE